VHYYIDYEKFARDLEYGGDYVELGDGHIFSCY
jgi:antirestriction protein